MALNIQIKQAASALELQVTQMQAVIAHLRKTKPDLMLDWPKGLGKVTYGPENPT